MKSISIGVLCFAMVMPVVYAGAPETRNADSRAIEKVLVIGNSITLHPPAPGLEWDGNWGMAASAPEKDYVHLIHQKLKDRLQQVPALVISDKDGNPAGRVDQHLLKVEDLKEIDADLVIIQLGENEKAEELDQFGELYEQFVKELKGAGDPIILCLGIWTPTGKSELKDEIIRGICERQGAHFVQISPAPPRSAAHFDRKFTNQAVNWYPGDTGMAHYADRIWTVLDPLLGEAGFQSSRKMTDGFEYDIKNLRRTWRISGTGFVRSIEVRMDGADAKEGAKSLEIVLPEVKDNEEGRVMLDIFPDFPISELAQVRFGMWIQDSQYMIRRGIYFGDKFWTNHFVHYFSQKLVDREWNEIHISRKALHVEAGSPTWTNVTQMRLSFWFEKGAPGNVLKLDDLVLDAQSERTKRLNKVWFE